MRDLRLRPTPCIACSMTNFPGGTDCTSPVVENAQLKQCVGGGGMYSPTFCSNYLFLVLFTKLPQVLEELTKDWYK